MGESADTRLTAWNKSKNLWILWVTENDSCIFFLIFVFAKLRLLTGCDRWKAASATNLFPSCLRNTGKYGGWLKPCEEVFATPHLLQPSRQTERCAGMCICNEQRRNEIQGKTDRASNDQNKKMDVKATKSLETNPFGHELGHKTNHVNS